MPTANGNGSRFGLALVLLAYLQEAETPGRSQDVDRQLHHPTPPCHQCPCLHRTQACAARSLRLHSSDQPGESVGSCCVPSMDQLLVAAASSACHLLLSPGCLAPGTIYLWTQITQLFVQLSPRISSVSPKPRGFCENNIV